MYCLFSTFLSKGLSDIQFHLAESQTKRVNTKKSHGLFQMIPFSSFKNNKVILVQECDKWVQGFFSLHLLQLQNVLLP